MRYPALFRSTAVLSAFGLVVAAPLNAQRAYQARSASVQINGKSIGTVQSVDGGYAVGDVVADQVGPDNVTMKHISNIHFVPLTIRSDVSDLDDVAIQALSGPGRMDAVVTMQSFDMKAMSTTTLSNALVTRISFTDLDGASREPMYMEVELTPELIRRSDGGGAAEGKMALRQRKLLRSNYRVDIPGLETKRVTSVTGLTLTRPVVADAVGMTREPSKIPMRWNASNLVLTVSAADEKSWQAWADDFLMKGNNGQDKEKTIEVHLVTSDQKSDVLVLRGSGVGLVSLRPSTAAANEIQRLEAELYVEKWEIVKGPGAEP
jgi:hypothetical protein